MSGEGTSRQALIREVLERLLALNPFDPDLSKKVAALKAKAAKALKAPVVANQGHLLEARERSIQSKRDSAAAARSRILPHINKGVKNGHTGYAALARYLTENQVDPPKGKRWFANTVRRIMEDPTNNH